MLSMIQQLEAIHVAKPPKTNAVKERAFRGLTGDIIRAMENGEPWDSGKLAQHLDRHVRSISGLLLRLAEMRIIHKIGTAPVPHGGREKGVYVLNKGAL